MNGVPNTTLVCYAECEGKWCYHPTLNCCYNIAMCYPTLTYVPPSVVIVDGRKVEVSQGWKPNNNKPKEGIL